MGDCQIDMDGLDKLTALLYSAVFDASLWQRFLDEVTRTIGGVRVQLLGHDTSADISLGYLASGYDPDFLQSYSEYYGEMNAWAPGFAEVVPGVVTPVQKMRLKDELLATEFYNDWVRPQEDVAAGGGVFLLKDETRVLAFGGNIRLADEEKLEREWLRTVSVLAPHLKQAFEIARMLASQSLENDLLRKGDIRGEAAVLLVAENGFVLFANSAAMDMLLSGAILRDTHHGRVSFSDSGAAAFLDQCLIGLRNGLPTVSRTFHARARAGSSGEHLQDYTIRAVTFDPARHNVPSFPLTIGYAGQSLLVTIAPDTPAGSELSAFAEGHGLTAAETAIALGIADGKTQAELAEHRAVSIHTVRNQLKSAMWKMGVHRQADVVRILIGLRP
ncbi:helix-turn-helix transcriptional regulator [Pelagibacterium xiamenense]|uniref:helix-turn-helix transcriptional regulator n=1 Tax=Pelagibacterium xiamenense TaxID=2901140 RepID=UPI001E4C9CEA|nr:helix-turn-helix transcriptional regulator [Pelagibacterium xiamenense]MCD7060991.1 helix-turn-helix transcriptional regulator [Pelagibacterium xiamenense]